MLFQDSTWQIFLTIYHGSLISTFFYDYVIRNVCRMIAYKTFDWQHISNIAVGVVFIVIIIWAILSVWARQRRNLFICLIILVIIFIVRLAIGIPDTLEKRNQLPRNQYIEELSVFIAQAIVHLFGIIGTYALYSNA